MISNNTHFTQKTTRTSNTGKNNKISLLINGGGRRLLLNKSNLNQSHFPQRTFHLTRDKATAVTPNPLREVCAAVATEMLAGSSTCTQLWSKKESLCLMLCGIGSWLLASVQFKAWIRGNLNKGQENCIQFILLIPCYKLYTMTKFGYDLFGFIPPNKQEFVL